ncbi:TerB family tellurite resistance protein [Halobacteriovorax sp. GB3]|uniref:TerB family tellurite resistance protein n=1 Tax=Halobacteriovorax sp. GB3 TaxID=2719615 RepID=UPI00235DCA1F|nr:TerB family tellurite resistance protein [Halobacteriovorax sp. GB3]MDD0854274.1 TerB family tellurite resistance protein [Halobacteriovorax sp. GB3]
MEKILAWIGVIIAWFLIQLAWRFIVSGVSAAGRTVTGKGNFKDNLNASFFGMEDFQMRLVDQPFENGEKNNLKVKSIEVKGRFPITSPKNAALVISVLDTTEEESLPVLSVLEDYREPDTAAFQAVVPMGQMKPEFGFPSWTKVGGFLPEFLETAYKGNRKLSVFLRLVDLENPPTIRLGYHGNDQKGLLWIQGQEFQHNMIYAGYREEQENRIKAHCSIIKLGVFAALSDNEFNEEEGLSIKKWMYQTLCFYSDFQFEDMKALFNQTFKEAYSQHQNGQLSVSDICATLNEIDNDSYKYEAVELCYDVVAADKKIETEEASMIRKISETLKLDFKEIEKIKDKRLVGLDSNAIGGASVEELLGINESMTPDEINSHLRREFQKWNSRLNTLPEGEERENAQKMLDLIAEARNNRAA